MASSPEASCLSDPNFAVICAFLEKFAGNCGITYPTFSDLQEMLENAEQVPQELVELHIKLLRKARKTVFLEKWEKALIKFCHTYSSQDGWEIERFGYKKSRLEVKLRVLKMLLEGQFDLNSKFKASINSIESDQLRTKPIGKDNLGRIYWLQFDTVSNIRVYREDVDEESWTLVAQDRESMVNLLKELSGDDCSLDLNTLSNASINTDVDKEQLLDTGQKEEPSTINNNSCLVKMEVDNLISENCDLSNSCIVPNGETPSDADADSKNHEILIPATDSDDILVKNRNEEIQTERNEIVTIRNNHTEIEKNEVKNGNIIDSGKLVDTDIGDNEIEEPVMYIVGEGCGEDCLTGNTEREEESDEKCQQLNSENIINTEPTSGTGLNSSESSSIPVLLSEKLKTTPKLWSIDTICGVSCNSNSKEANESVFSDSEKPDTMDSKLKQKTFSSFSIDSVLEKKESNILCEKTSISKFTVDSSCDNLPDNVFINAEKNYSANEKHNSALPVSNEKFCKNAVLISSSSSKTENFPSELGSEVLGSSTENCESLSLLTCPIVKSIPILDKFTSEQSPDCNTDTLVRVSKKLEVNRTELNPSLHNPNSVVNKLSADTNMQQEKIEDISKALQKCKNVEAKKGNVQILQNIECVKKDIDFNESKPSVSEKKISDGKKETFSELQKSIVSGEHSEIVFEGDLLNVEIEKVEKKVLKTELNMNSVNNNKIEIEKPVGEDPLIKEENLTKIDTQECSKVAMHSAESNKIRIPEINFKKEKDIQPEPEGSIKKIEKKCEDITEPLETNSEEIEEPSFSSQLQKTEPSEENFKVVTKNETADFSKKEQSIEVQNLIKCENSEKRLQTKFKVEQNCKTGSNTEDAMGSQHLQPKNDSDTLLKTGFVNLKEASGGELIEEKETENNYINVISNLSQNKNLDDEKDFIKISKSQPDSFAGESTNSSIPIATQEKNCETLTCTVSEETKSGINPDELILKGSMGVIYKNKMHDETEVFKINTTHGENFERHQLINSVQVKPQLNEEINLKMQSDIKKSMSEENKEGNDLGFEKTPKKGPDCREEIENPIQGASIEVVAKENSKIILDQELKKNDFSDKTTDQIQEVQNSSLNNIRENVEKSKILLKENLENTIEDIEFIVTTGTEPEVKHFTEDQGLTKKIIFAEQNLEHNKIQINKLYIQKSETAEETTKELEDSENKKEEKASLKIEHSIVIRGAEESKHSFKENNKKVNEEESLKNFKECEIQFKNPLHKSDLETKEKMYDGEVKIEEGPDDKKKLKENSDEKKLNEYEERNNSSNESEIKEIINCGQREENFSIQVSVENTEIEGLKKKQYEGDLSQIVLPENMVAASEEGKTEETKNLKKLRNNLETIEYSEDPETKPSDIENKEKQESEKETDEDKVSVEDSLAATEASSDVVQEKGQQYTHTPLSKGRKGWRRRRRKRQQKINRDESKAVIEDQVKLKKDEADKKEKPDKEGYSKKTASKKEQTTPRSGGRSIASREMKLLGITEPINIDTPSIRQSRRIAQIKLKEEAERRRVEAAQLESFKSKKKGPKSGRKKSKKAVDSDSYDEKDENESDDTKLKPSKDKRDKKKRKKKDKLVFDELNPWLSSSGSSSADEEEEDIEDDPHEEEELVFKSDHEFSPESDVEDPDYKPIKIARTAKVEVDSEAKSGKYDDTSCEKCQKNDHPEWILLCDNCDKGWHASCLRPALMIVPEGDWFCPPCDHIALLSKLREGLIQYDRCQKQRENEELRKKRLAFVGISLDNVLPTTKKKSDDEGKERMIVNEEVGSEYESGSGSETSELGSGSDDSSEPVYQLRERRSNVTSYRYNEYDELIKSAIQDEIEAVKGAGNSGKGKDINNIVNAEKQREDIKENNQGIKDGAPDEENAVKEKDSKSEKVEDQEFREDSEEEEEEDLADEIPPVVPRYSTKKKKSKSVNVTSLDFTSEEEDNNSDSDFKGASSEEESDFSLASESSLSDERRRKRGDGPLRRSTRARTSRYDRDFINDDSDDSPKRKKSRRAWDSSESSDSDQSWGKRKKKTCRSTYKSPAKKSSSKNKKKKKGRSILDSDNEEDITPKKTKNRKVKYGGLESFDEDQVLTTRTRGKKINYQEINGSDSEDDTIISKSKSSRIIESDDDFVAENEKDDALEENSEEDESESGEDEREDEELEYSQNKNKNLRLEGGEIKIMEKRKKKKPVIPDPDDFSENDLMEDEQLDRVTKELDNLDEEEEEILSELLESGDIPVHELKNAVKKVKNERKAKKNEEEQEKKSEILVKPDPLSEANSIQILPSPPETPNSVGKFPKIGKMKITPSRAELASQVIGKVPSSTVVNSENPVNLEQNSTLIFPPTKREDNPGTLSPQPKYVDSENPVGGLLLKTLQGDPKPASTSESDIPNDQPVKTDSLIGEKSRPFIPYSTDYAPGSSLNALAMMNSQSQGLSPPSSGVFDINTGRPIHPILKSFPGMMSSPPRLPVFPPEIPTTVTGISTLESQSSQRKKPGPKPGSKTKRKIEDSLLQPESENDSSGLGENNSSLQQGNEFPTVKSIQESPPKKKGRGRGKKQLLAEAQAQALAQSQTQRDGVIAPNQFPSLPPETGSVISRILNTPQVTQNFTGNRPPFGPRLGPHFSVSSRPIPPGLRLRHPVPGAPMFHTSHPHDPSPSGGGAINIVNAGLRKPSPSPTGFVRPPGIAVPSRFPLEPGVRLPFPAQNSPPRPEFSTFPNYYGNFPQSSSSVQPGESPCFQNPTFPEPFNEEAQTSEGIISKQGEDDAGGEFGGLASYFASQREDDIDT